MPYNPEKYRFSSRSMPACLLRRLLLLGLTCCFSQAALGAHAIALHGQPRYPADFRHFDYADPQAPQGGELFTSSMGNFEKLNPYTLKGRAADGLQDLVFETLAVPSWDEPDTMYGLLAEDIALAPDELSMTFRLDRKARFSNGDPVTAADVKYSFDQLVSKQAAPLYRQYWSDVKQMVVVDDHTVRAEFRRKNHELRIIVCQLPVFSRKWGGGKSFDKITLDAPIASGPYVVESFDLGKRITYRRNHDYWANEHPARKGMFNFERITYRYYRDTLARMEGLKAGEIDLIQENSSKNWARNHQGKHWDDGDLIKALFPHRNGAGWQGFAMNTRHPLFQDRRVRQALGLAMDFEWMNRQLFFNLYTRSPSYFTNTEMAATGKPDAKELAVLRELQARFGDKVPAEVFDEIPPPPTTLPPHSLRDNLRKARELLAQAGWTYRDGALRNAQGEPFQFEMMLEDRMQERASAPYARNLEKLGIEMNYRIYDPALYQRKAENFDYDMVWALMPGSQSPGNELFDYFGSASRDQAGSNNAMGVADPVIDALLARIVQSEHRDELVTLVRVLDRLLRLGYYIVPHFYSNAHRVSYRSTLAYPKVLPKFYRIEDWSVATWWKKPAGEGSRR
ncbi:ABC transporter substrate-binding protein [Ferrigenium kumadai]|uniref:ABC transporter substrate-binding protein n=1 Tax=Ferrigenium kumadai TaxID=1682490 RepID=A0AAN1T1M2_9PROT|nr:ABC transporter substrate-binding protein [Ferrigenium kumadai]